jgi:hypothetical protein
MVNVSLLAWVIKFCLGSAVAVVFQGIALAQ